MTFTPPTRWQFFKADVYALLNPSARCRHQPHRPGLRCRRHWVLDRLCGSHVHCVPGNPDHDRKAQR